MPRNVEQIEGIHDDSDLEATLKNIENAEADRAANVGAVRGKAAFASVGPVRQRQSSSPTDGQRRGESPHQVPAWPGAPKGDQSEPQAAPGSQK